MKTQILTCIECPMGCQIQVNIENGKTVSVQGNGCLRGKAYAENEVICPKRVVTSTVRAKNGQMIPVKTDKPVKKSEIFDVMKKINATVCELPVKIGDILVKNICDEANLIATGNSLKENETGSGLKDYFGRNAERLKEKKLFLFDMDGTIYRENDLFDGIKDMLSEIEKKGGRYAFITNNPSKSVKDYIKKLRRMGIERVKEDNFFTSAQVAIMIFKEKFGNRLIYAQGTKSFIKCLKKSGLNVTQEYTDEACAVLVAYDPELTGEKLRTTCKMLTKHNLPYYATNPDWVCPVEFGFVPDCGCMCEGIARATGKTPVFIGKPEPTMVSELMRKYNFTKEETVVVGDRLYTDIAAGINAGVDAVCVLSGEATLADIKNAAENVKPTFVFAAAKDILNG